MVLCTSSTPSAHAWVVSARGEIDLATAPALRDEVLRRLRQGHVVLDLAGVSFFDSAGLHALVASHRRATLLGNRLCVAGAGPSVLTVLRLTQVLDVLDLHEDRTAALRALDPHRRPPVPAQDRTARAATPPALPAPPVA